MQIYDRQGHRLYLTGSERAAFRTAAAAAPREVRTYCWTLLYTGFLSSLKKTTVNRGCSVFETPGCDEEGPRGARRAADAQRRGGGQTSATFWCAITSHIVTQRS